MMLVLLNGENIISEESNNNDVGWLANKALCAVEVVNLDSNWENWVKYAMIKYKININSTLTVNIHTTADKYDSWMMNGK